MTNNYPECTSRAQELGYGSVYQARVILERLGLPKEHMLELNAVRPGELALATVPGEIFNTCGAYGYFTTVQACEYGRYEADTRKYAKGSAEEMVENLVEMLYELSK